jgi:hypothetical protein
MHEVVPGGRIAREARDSRRKRRKRLAPLVTGDGRTHPLRDDEARGQCACRAQRRSGLLSSLGPATRKEERLMIVRGALFSGVA